MPFQNDVERLRGELKGWSREQLATEAGLLRATVRRIETGECEPTAETMWRIARALGISVEEVFHYTEAGQPTLKQKAARLARKIALATATALGLFAFFAIFASATLVVEQFQAERAWAAGDYFKARQLESQLSPLLHPWAELALDNALRADLACRPGFGQPITLPAVSASRAWLDQYGGLAEVESFGDAGGNLLHQLRADCLDRVGASGTAFDERMALIQHPWIPGPFNAITDYTAYVTQASRAALMGDTIVARRLLAVADENHHAKLERLFKAHWSLPYNLKVLRPLFLSLGRETDVY